MGAADAKHAPAIVKLLKSALKGVVGVGVGMVRGWDGVGMRWGYVEDADADANADGNGNGDGVGMGCLNGCG